MPETTNLNKLKLVVEYLKQILYILKFHTNFYV